MLEKMLVYQIKTVPDLSLSKYQAFADSGIDGMLQAQTQFLRQLHRVATLGNISVHMFFDYVPKNQAGNRIKVRLAFLGELIDDVFRDKLRKIVKSSGIYEYFSFFETNDAIPRDETFKHMCIMCKKERFLPTMVNGINSQFYVVPNWKMNDDARLYNIFKIMESFNESCLYRVDMFAPKELDDDIHKAFERPLSFLRNVSRQEKGISEYSRIHTEKTDPNANETLKQYEDWLKAVDTSPVFLCRVCSFANDAQYAQLLVDAAVSECIESGNVSLIVNKIPKDYFENDIMEFQPDGNEKFSLQPELIESIGTRIPESLKKWSLTFTLEEVAAFSRFPVLYDGENIEIPKETSASLTKDGSILGHDVNGHEVRIPLNMFPKHMFVCGVPGAGKTNTMLHIANNLWNYEMTDEEGKSKKAHIPFLVLEPAKREYRELALFDIPELIIFSPSACANFPMKLNPFEFPVGLTLSEHIGKLCRVFEGAFPIPAPTPFILDKSIQGIYEKHSWDVKDINTGEKDYPTMSELYEQFAYEMERTNYDGEMKGNIRSVLEVRIGSLLRRELKEMFDVPKSTLSPEEWLKKPVVIELEALGEGPANFVTLLLCTLIRETLKVNPMEDREKPVRHVIFIEEAHNLISSESRVDKPEDSNPKIAATAFIVKMLAEVRALREGIIIADQLPTAMAPEVIKNTNIKLVHRLTSQDDRQLVGSTMSASPLQLENMATYRPGHALFSYEDLLRPFEMQVFQLSEHGEKTPTDMRLYELMIDNSLHPAYVDLCRKEALEMWEKIKKQIQNLVEECKSRTSELQDMPINNISYATISKHIDTLKNSRILLHKRLASLRTDIELLRFIEKEDKENVLNVLGQSAAAYEKMCDKKSLIWIKQL